MDSTGANTNFVTLDQIVHKQWLSPLILPIFTTFGEERVVKNWLKKIGIVGFSFSNNSLHTKSNDADLILTQNWFIVS